MSNEEKRVVLVKPGDLLLIGNVGSFSSAEQAQGAIKLFKDMGIRVVFFTGDIDLDKLDRSVVPE